jgi:hypothetical protein
LIQYWLTIVETYCVIVQLFAATDEEPAGAIINRIHQSIQETTTLSTSQSQLVVKTQDLAAWVEHGQGSWFAWMHSRYGLHLMFFLG